MEWTSVGDPRPPLTSPHPNPLLNAAVPYRYSWEVRDLHGCASTGSVQLVDEGPDNRSRVIEQGDYAISCFGQHDGSMKLEFGRAYNPGFLVDMHVYDEGGNMLFEALNTYLEPSVNGLFAGTYYSVMESTSGCIDTVTLELTEPDSLIISQVTTSQYHTPDNFEVECSYLSNGSIAIQHEGGHPLGTFTYSWEQDGQLLAGATSNAISNLPVGDYSVTVVDRNNFV